MARRLPRLTALVLALALVLGLAASAAAVTKRGDRRPNSLSGTAGADRLFGGAGDDVFHNRETEFESQQAAFRDLLDGGGGNDTAEVAPSDRYRLITGRIFVPAV